MTNFREMDTEADRPVVVVGSGVAGLATALSLAPAPVHLVTAGRLDADSSSAWAQGGIAAALAADDSPQLHAHDTVAAGAGLVDEKVARAIAEVAPQCIEWLTRLGVPFDRAPDGGYSLGLEGAHSRRRIARVGGDGIGRALVDALAAAVRRSEHVQVLERHRVIDLLGGGRGAGDRAGGGGGGGNRRVSGVLAVDSSGRPRRLAARAVVLATGGIGSIYSTTTNPPGALGHGIALALRAGAAIRDAEFVQFHPTAIDIGRTPMPLATEALRGEGAVLVDGNGAAILEGSDGELAPRDVVSRAIARRLAGGDRERRGGATGGGRTSRHDAGGGRTSGGFAGEPACHSGGAAPSYPSPGSRVYLDATRAVGAAMPERFPAVTAACRAAGIDPVREAIPVRPAAHYHMGGIAVDSHGRSGIAGLYACGEVACTGLHGANRLASNSLLEAIASAKRVAGAIAGEAGAGERTCADLAHRRSTAGIAAADVAGRLAKDGKATNGAGKLSANGGDPAALYRTAENGLQRARRSADSLLKSIRELSGRFVGVERDGEGLRKAIAALAPLAFGIDREGAGADHSPGGLAGRTAAPPAHAEYAPSGADSAALVALAVAVAAERRRESRGGHYRGDYPDTDPAQARSSTLTLADIRCAVADITGEHGRDARAAVELADVATHDESALLAPAAGAHR